MEGSIDESNQWIVFPVVLFTTSAHYFLLELVELIACSSLELREEGIKAYSLRKSEGA